MAACGGHVSWNNRRRTIGLVDFRMAGKGSRSIPDSLMFVAVLYVPKAKSCSAYKRTPPNGDNSSSHHPCHSCPVLSRPLRRTCGVHSPQSNFAKRWRRYSETRSCKPAHRLQPILTRPQSWFTGSWSPKIQLNAKG